LKYKLIIFDFDGTLADTFPFVLSVMDQVIEKFNLRRIDRSEVEMLRNYDAHKVIKYLGIPAWKVPVIGKHAAELLTREIHRLTLFEGVEQVLQNLSERGVQLAIVTSNSYKNVRSILGPETAALIQYYECGVPIFGKQSKLKRVLKKSGIAAADTLCIGDEIRDIHAARKLKIPFGAVAWGYTNEDALRACSPNELFRSVTEIEEIAS